MIIGLVGYIGAGKTDAAEILVKEHGFKKNSFGKAVREEAIGRGLPIDRGSLQKLGYDLRQEFGEEVLARRIIKELDLSGENNYVIEGFRSAGDILPFKKLSSFILVWIEVPFEKRCKRILARGREGDPKTREQFKRADEIDRGIVESGYHQNTDECLKFVDITIDNSGSILELDFQIKKLVGEIKC